MTLKHQYNVDQQWLDDLPCPGNDLQDIRQRLLTIRQDMLQKEKAFTRLQHIHPAHKRSARNLLQYLAVRSHDIRTLQYELTNWGLSSLGRMERKVQATIDTIIHIISALMQVEWRPEEKPPFCFEEGRKMLDDNATALFGDPPNGRRARIMVTMPSEAAEDYGLICNLLDHGMNIARINCAHDNPDIWLKIINHLKRAEEFTGHKCKIHMDLGGPKLRTSDIEEKKAVLKVRPKRDEYGAIIESAVIYLYPTHSDVQPKASENPCIWVDSKWLKNLKEGSSVRFKDARGSSRTMVITMVNEYGATGSMDKTAYLTTDTVLTAHKKRKKITTTIYALPVKENVINLEVDDHLILFRKDMPGHPGEKNDLGHYISWPFIGCTLPEALTEVTTGEPIWFDDGKIGGLIEEVLEDKIVIKVTHAKSGGEKLKKEKGINLPESMIKLSAITDQDIEDLKFVVKYADTVGLSFANGPEDVQTLIDEMKKISAKSPGIILKIETARGFHKLPEMLLTAMQTPKSGVMIARGDLAIECGFGRLAELQEQILWICEAAHMPVIWATQVLESLAKTGVQTRSEITDAAMGQRAECIMLNKGTHIVKATTALDDILRRMQDHQTKKRSTHRKLHLAEDFYNRWPEE